MTWSESVASRFILQSFWLQLPWFNTELTTQMQSTLSSICHHKFTVTNEIHTIQWSPLNLSFLMNQRTLPFWLSEQQWSHKMVELDVVQRFCQHIRNVLFCVCVCKPCCLQSNRLTRPVPINWAMLFLQNAGWHSCADDHGLVVSQHQCWSIQGHSQHPWLVPSFHCHVHGHPCCHWLWSMGWRLHSLLSL